VKWINADDVRKKYNDWDFSHEGRIRQSIRMRELADSFLNDFVILNGNYSWNKLVKTVDDDPIIPAFNTPEHKYNLGFTIREYGFDDVPAVKWGLGANYKWIQGFVFEGSPQFTGLVPSYDLIDAQVNALLVKSHVNIKVGCSNLLNKMNIQTYGGPRIGRLAYVSLSYEL
jgi:hypothetical protein